MRYLLAVVVLAVLAGCAQDTSPDIEGPATGTPAGGAPQQEHPDIVAVDVERENGAYTFHVTVSSPYDTPQRYADGWRVMGPDGTVFGEHTLLHDHADEQPFTRSQRDVEIPDDVSEVTIEGRDSEHGYGGATMTVPLP